MANFKKFICIFLVALPYFLSAQDTIFTKTGDTICCTITKIDPSNIYFNTTNLNETKSMMLSLKNVADYRSVNPIEFNIQKYKYPKIRLSFDGGLSYQTKKLEEDTPQELKGFYNRLKSGYQYGIGIQYFASKNLGFGLKYSHFRSKKAMNYFINNYGIWNEYIQNEDVNIDFIGPTFNFRGMHNKNRNSFIVHVGVGYLHYLDRVLSYGINATGHTYGLEFGVNYDLKVAENLAIGVDVSYIMGTLSKWKLSDGVYSETSDLQHNNNLHHLDISIGLRLIK